MALFVEIGAKIDGLLTGLNQARNAMGGFAKATSDISKGVMTGNLGAAFDTLAAAAASGTIPVLGLVAAVSAVVGAFSGFKVMQYAKEMEAIAEASGFTMTQVLGLQRAFEKQGLEMTQLAPMMAKARMEIENLKDPSSRASNALRALRLGSKDFIGKTNAEMLQTLASAGDRAKDAGKYLAAMTQLFGLEKGGKMSAVVTTQNLELSKQQANPAAADLERAGGTFKEISATLSLIKDSFLAIGQEFFAQTAPLWLGLAKLIAYAVQDLYLAGKAVGEFLLDLEVILDIVFNTIFNLFVAGSNLLAKSVGNTFLDFVTAITFGLVRFQTEAQKKERGDKDEGKSGISLPAFETGWEKDVLEKTIGAFKPKDQNDQGMIGGVLPIPRSLFEETKAALFGPKQDENLPKIPPMAAIKPLASIVSDLTKSGGGGLSFGADVTLDVQRLQLVQQTRTSSLLEQLVAQGRTRTVPTIPGLVPDLMSQ